MGLTTKCLRALMEIMRNEFMAVVRRTDDTYTAVCPEVPEALGEGRTKLGALVALRVAVVQILDERRATATRNAPADAMLEVICLE